MSEHRQAIPTWLSLVGGFLIGGIVVGGVVLWLVERRLERYFSKNKPQVQVQRPRIAARKPRPRSRRRVFRRVRRLSPAQHQEMLARLARERRQISSPHTGLLYRKKLLTMADVKRILGAKEPLKHEFLQGRPRSEHYDALHFAPKQPRRKYKTFFGLAVQLWWSPGLATVRERWQRYRSRYGKRQPPTTRPTRRPFRKTLWFRRKTSRSMIAYWDGKQALLFLTCHVEFCRPGQMITLAWWVHHQLQSAKH